MRLRTIMLLLLCTCLSAASTSSSVIGIWQGKVHIDGKDYRIVLHIGTDAGGTSATLDSPDTGKLAIPLPSLKADETSVTFELNDPQASFMGNLSRDRATLIGDWKQNDKTTAVTLERLSKSPEFDKDGPYLFLSQCSSCHAVFNPIRAPWPTTLKLMPQSAVLNALENGKMSAIGKILSHEQRVALASYLGRPAAPQPSAQANLCSATGPAMTNSPVWNGWGPDLSNTRFQTSELAGLNKSQLSRLRLKWSFGYAGATGAGGPPTIIGDHLFVGGGDGRVYALDAHSGCIYWTFLPSALARTAITVSPDGTLAYFGDMQARIYAVNAATGALVWKTDLDHHPFAMITGAPKLYGNRLYVPVSSAEELAAVSPKYPCCTFRGSLNALDAKTGNRLWQTYTIPNAARPTSTNSAGTGMLGPSGAGVWSSPTIDPSRHALYVGTGDNYSDPGSDTSDAVMAFDLDTGKILWVKQLTAEDRFNVSCMAPNKSNCPKEPGGDFDIGAPPILAAPKNGKAVLLVGQKSGVVYALDPDDHGDIVWSTRISKGGVLGGIEFGGALNGTRVYFPVSDWSYDPKTGGGIFALDVATGKVVWFTPAPVPGCLEKPSCSAAQPAPATAIPDVVFASSLDGHLRAYDALDGTIVWDFDTAHDFTTVNGVEAHGGSINYAGPVIAGGMLFVTSGYSFNSGMPGNVLLALSEDGK